MSIRSWKRSRLAEKHWGARACEAHLVDMPQAPRGKLWFEHYRLELRVSPFRVQALRDCVSRLWLNRQEIVSPDRQKPFQLSA